MRTAVDSSSERSYDVIIFDNIRHPPIGSEIRRLRQARGWTLAELARRVGTSAPTLHRYENGWDQFKMDTLRKIAAALGASLEVRLVDRACPTTPLGARALVRRLAPSSGTHGRV